MEVSLVHTDNLRERNVFTLCRAVGEGWICVLAFDTSEDLTAMRERMKSSGVPSPQYNRLPEQQQNSLVPLKQK